jgi:hypothetical protein
MKNKRKKNTQLPRKTWIGSSYSAVFEAHVSPCLKSNLRISERADR